MKTPVKQQKESLLFEEILLSEQPSFNTSPMSNKQHVQLITPQISPICQRTMRRLDLVELAHDIQIQLYKQQFLVLTSDLFDIEQLKLLPEYQMGEDVVKKVFLDVSNNKHQIDIEQFVEFKKLCYSISKVRYYGLKTDLLSFKQIQSILHYKPKDLQKVFSKLKLNPNAKIQFSQLY